MPGRLIAKDENKYPGGTFFRAEGHVRTQRSAPIEAVMRGASMLCLCKEGERWVTG
jgi:hypothetical protein